MKKSCIEVFEDIWRMIPKPISMRFLLIFFAVFLFQALVAQDMTLKRMGKIFRAEVEEIEEDKGVWTLTYGEIPLLVITDEAANRMRMFTPIVLQKDLEKGEFEIMLMANFHSALDAKYALYDGFVVSLYTHPLKELQKDQLIDAMQQVVILAKTFGSSYSSTDMIFGGDLGKEEAKPKVNRAPNKNTKRS